MCLSVWNRSPQAHKDLQTSGMLVLPSGRLLQLYKNSIKQSPGMNKEVFELMRNEAIKWKISLGGMAIQEDLQLKQENGLMKLVGLVDMGEEDACMRTLHKGK